MASDRLILPVGKLPPDLLSELISMFPGTAVDPTVLVGPGIGEDAAVVRVGDELIAIKTDPITFATDQIGWYLVCVNANDVASMGADPRWMLATFLLPEGEATEGMIKSIASQVAEACKKLGITFCGGHTEVTADLPRPIAVGAMVGRLEGEPITSSGARPGDLIILTKRPALEATSIIAREMETELKGKVPDDVVERAKRMLFEPGISAVEEARAAREAGEIHAMHDLTEGGLYNGLLEICIRSKVDAVIHRERIKLYPETELLCGLFDIDPLGAISSGSMLIVSPPQSAQRIAESIRSSGVECWIIGEVVEGEGRAWLEEGGELREIEYRESDEIAKLFEGSR